MKELRLFKSRIIFGPAFQEFRRCVPQERVVVITDRNLFNLYGHLLSPYKVLKIEPGESSKNLKTIYRLYLQLMKHGSDRSSFLLGFGGGVVLDITGFVASTFLRGLHFAYMPTTLLAQVDAAVGGKNGINLKGYKNLVGTITQPDLVLIDPTFLSSLPETEKKNGFAEVIKHAVIGDSDLFALLEHEEKERLFRPAVLERIIFDAVRVKVKIVRKDERERGERRKLNLGHTFGHAIEKVLRLPHGEAVSIGMAIEARLSFEKGLLREEDLQRILALLKRFDLPTAVLNDIAWMDAIRKDKKREGLLIHAVLIEEIGRARVELLELSELERMIHDLC